MRTAYLIPFACLLIFFNSCHSPERSLQSASDSTKQFTAPIAFDLDSIRNRGYLTAIVDNSATSMFLYRGEPMGYEYELISQFADTLGLELRFKITNSIEDGFNLLNKGEGDIMAHNLTITSERKKIIDFTESHYNVRQMLVQRKPDNWRDMKLHEIENTLIRNPIELISKEVFVRGASAHASRLKNLSDEIGGEILVIEEADVETELLMQMVADSSINYTVADENVARMIARFYPNLDVETAVSFPQQIAWGVRSNADSLRTSINNWLAGVKGSASFNDLFNKYFKNPVKTKSILKSEFYSTSGQHISPYDSLLQEAAKQVGWDWKLLSAQVSKESRFDPEAKSWVGAIGLLQVMPKTGREYGVRNLKDPIQNVKAAVQHILWLQERWPDLTDSLEKQKFVLASYNVGHAHVKDAVNLVKKYGGDPTQWADVAKYLLLKSQRRYYEDPVVRFGYCRGSEPVDYVEDILFRYRHYVQLDTSQVP